MQKTYIWALVSLLASSLVDARSAVFDQTPLDIGGSDDSFDSIARIDPNNNDLLKSEMDKVIASSELLSLHRALVEIKSISDNEQAVGGFLMDYLYSKNFTVEKQYVDYDDPTGKPIRSNRRFNIYAYPGNSASPGIILTSHIDTVPPFIPYSLSHPESASFKRDDILISGRGTVDDKASVACQVIAAMDHLEKHPDIPIGLLFVVSEEVGGRGMSTFSNSRLNSGTYHTIIFGEPTERALVAGHKGMVSFTIRVHGKPAHSGYPWLGRSAVSEMLPILTEVDRLGDIPVSQGGLPSSEKYGRTTLNIGFMSGGVAANVVAEEAVANVAVRLAAGNPEDAKDIIFRAIRNAATKHRKDATVVISNGLERPKGDIEVIFGLEAYGVVDIDADVDGFNVTTVNYGTDVPHWKIYGDNVKRYLYGPGTIFVAHGKNEALTVGELEAGLEGYKTLVAKAAERERS
ncbi:TPA_exp: putative carboxypeptidase [Trichophyton benhamiae CBS 112371]|uniref:Probable carboxypeptidase ARB_01041 n=1 Tax=Arthroderma benhamiae (strain ATCC MYA-4681 / CBS 112371) TaxID=663331 RepID=P20D1_ARTBC|nr:peptidase, putative [Trichophyton benhamiae CBS 112371]D4AXX2.1 RecName: Full=Probable carboxypeptidase ARB_01041; AltName: Full=Peptidase M20 domain-containing protein ARB_01041; Flags: Precursor [Trichophyton benhamiae CBS 112371]EFE32150.1 peptidase, putative [Trichophyton benhamiae CBS 112371]DAA75254.1 TPA_exp: putative carboxypeptidase [Trichophyton benhamiae CBS 112371]